MGLDLRGVERNFSRLVESNDNGNGYDSSLRQAYGSLVAIASRLDGEARSVLRYLRSGDGSSGIPLFALPMRDGSSTEGIRYLGNGSGVAIAINGVVVSDEKEFGAELKRVLSRCPVEDIKEMLDGVSAEAIVDSMAAFSP